MHKIDLWNIYCHSDLSHVQEERPCSLFLTAAESISEYPDIWSCPGFQWVQERSFCWEGIPPESDADVWGWPSCTLGTELLWAQPVPKKLHHKPDKVGSWRPEAFSLYLGLKPPKIGLQSRARTEGKKKKRVFLKSEWIISLSDAIHLAPLHFNLSEY